VLLTLYSHNLGFWPSLASFESHPQSYIKYNLVRRQYHTHTRPHERLLFPSNRCTKFYDHVPRYTTSWLLIATTIATCRHDMDGTKYCYLAAPSNTTRVVEGEVQTKRLSWTMII